MTSTQRSHADQDPCTTIHLPFDVSAPSEARARMVAELRAAGLREQVVDDAEFVLGELVANGIEHGSPSSAGMIEVSWCMHDDRLLISVRDSGPGAVSIDAGRLTDDALRGRGLAMVDQLCERWSVDTDEGVRVTAELNFSAVSA